MEVSKSIREDVTALPTPRGTLTVRINGDGVPFIVRDITNEPWISYIGEAKGHEPEHPGRPKKVYQVELDTNGITKGSKIALSWDRDASEIGYGSGERLGCRIYESDGFTVASSYRDDEAYDNDWNWSFELLDVGTCQVIRDDFNSDPYTRTIYACVAWIEGTMELDSDIVEMAAYISL